MHDKITIADIIKSLCLELDPKLEDRKVYGLVAKYGPILQQWRQQETKKWN